MVALESKAFDYDLESSGSDFEIKWVELVCILKMRRRVVDVSSDVRKTIHMTYMYHHI